MNKSAYWIIGGLTLLILGGAFVTYVSNFGYHLSDSKTEWGAFGDYLNPFIAIINLVLLVYLAHVVAVNEEKRHRENLKFQANSNFLASRMEEARRMRTIAQSIFDVSPAEKEYEIRLHEKAYEIIAELNSFLINNEFLFKELVRDQSFIDNVNRMVAAMEAMVFNVMDRDELKLRLENNTEQFKSFDRRYKANLDSQGDEELEKEKELLSKQRTEIAGKMRVLFNQRKELAEVYHKEKNEFNSAIGEFIINPGE